MSELKKQQNGEWYIPTDIEITRLQDSSRILMREFNNEMDKSRRFEIMKKWFKEVGENTYIEPPLFCDFGCNFILEKNVYMNTGCTVLDSALVRIGENTMVGPNVQFYTPMHKINPEERLKQEEKALPITIGKNCWIGGNVVILPNITIGDNCVIGAGSVVTKNIPPNSVAVGNPCSVIKKCTD